MSNVPTMLVGELLLMKERPQAAVVDAERLPVASGGGAYDGRCPKHPDAERIIHGRPGLLTCSVCGLELGRATP